MIWIVLEKRKESFQVTGTNTHTAKDGKCELWATRPCGRTIKLSDGSEEEVNELKDAIDFAIKEESKTFHIYS